MGKGNGGGGIEGGGNIDVGGAVEVAEPGAAVKVSLEGDAVSTLVEETGVTKIEEKVVTVVEKNTVIDVSSKTEDEVVEVESTFGEKGIEGVVESLNSKIFEIRETEGLSDKEKNEIAKVNIEETMRAIGRSELTTEQKVEALNEIFRNLPKGAKKGIEVPESVNSLNPEKPFNDQGDAMFGNWPGNAGFEGKPEVCNLVPGQVFDRYGEEGGKYVSEVKDGISQSYDSRSLRQTMNPEEYHKYEVIKDMSDLDERLNNLTPEEIERLVTEKELAKPENERRSPEQIKEESIKIYSTLEFDMKNLRERRAEYAKENGWEDVNNSSKNVILKGKVAEGFSYVDKDGVEHKKGGGEQIFFPTSIETLLRLGYIKEI